MQFDTQHSLVGMITFVAVVNDYLCVEVEGRPKLRAPNSDGLVEPRTAIG